MSNSSADAQEHNQAFIDFLRAVVNPAHREAAKKNPILGNIVSKLSPDDFEALSKVMENQTLTNHGPLLQRLG